MKVLPEAASGLRGGVDLHAHWFAADLFASRATTGDWPRLVVDSAENGRILIGDAVFRQVRKPLWDVAARLADMDAAGIQTQVISPVPVTFPYAGPPTSDPTEAAVYAELVNRSIARAVSAAPGRLLGMGNVALPHVAAAIRELERFMTGLDDMVGVEIGARIGDLELDDPRLAPFFEAAEDLGALVFVHPSDGGSGTVRRSGQPYDFGIGMHADTALAAGALVFGGVLDRFPRLRILLAHGCGSFAWSYPRLRLGAELFAGRSPSALDEQVASLYVDSLVLDREHLRLLVHRFGADRVVAGTDHPFFPATTRDVGSFLSGAEAVGALPPGGAQRVFVDNGRALLADTRVAP